MSDNNDMIQQVTAAFQVTIATMSAQHEKEVNALNERIKELTAQVAWLNRQLFGRKSEKLPIYDPNYPDLFADQFASINKDAEEKRNEVVEKLPDDKPARAKKRDNRKILEDLPVLEREVLEPEEGVDLSIYKKIGEEVTRVIKHKPGQLYVKEIVRPKYGLIDNTQLPPSGQNGVLIAKMPLLPIYKGVADASLLAEILIQKYEYHMPFYRQIKQFEQLGMKGLNESTVDNWFKQTVSLLKPLYDALEEEVFKADYAQADETVLPVINNEAHKASKEYLWMIRAVISKLVIFYYYNGSRAGAVIETLARKHKYKGYLQCDGFAGYETAFKNNPDVTLINCMVHIRRHLEQALDENREAAQHAITEIQHLYKIEHMCDDANLTVEERLRKRQELSRPIMIALKTWMETEGVKYSQSSLIGKAITYAYTRWDNMMHYLDDGHILLDNNLAENEIRPITLGRKNYLFCGSHKAAEEMTVICSLLATCKNHGVNPREYLNDIIAKMPYHKKDSHEELVKLLPHMWKQQHQ